MDVSWNISCTPTQKTGAATLNTTHSNIKNQSNLGVGILSQKEFDGKILIYPNPANSIITVEILEQTEKTSIKIMNVIGHLIYEETVSAPANNKTQIAISTYAKGIYTISIESNGNKAYKKLVVN